MSNNTVIGIDPGINGGIALVNYDTDIAPILFPMPIRKIQYSGKTMSIIDPDELNILLSNLKKSKFCIIERQWTRPGEQPKGSFTMGHNYGQVKQCVWDLKIKLLEIDPKQWQQVSKDPYYDKVISHFGMDIAKNLEGKALSVQTLRALYPNVNMKPVGARVDKDGLAEAGLIGLSGILLDNQGRLNEVCYGE